MQHLLLPQIGRKTLLLAKTHYKNEAANIKKKAADFKRKGSSIECDETEETLKNIQDESSRWHIHSLKSCKKYCTRSEGKPRRKWAKKHLVKEK